MKPTIIIRYCENEWVGKVENITVDVYVRHKETPTQQAETYNIYYCLHILFEGDLCETIEFYRIDHFRKYHLLDKQEKVYKITRRKNEKNAL